MAQTFALTKRLVQEAFDRQMTLSALMEAEDPTGSYPVHEQHMDAFQRELARLDIRTCSDPEGGAPAHTWERFYASDDLGSGEERSVLANEWLNRLYRRRAAVNSPFALAGGWNPGMNRWDDTGARLTFDVPTSFTEYPPNIAPGLRFQPIAPSMLQYLIAFTRVINGEATYAMKLSSPSTAQSDSRMLRVEEYAEVPGIRLTTAEVATRVKKYGRRLDMSYEQMRRISLDYVSFVVQYIADQAQIDKENQAVDVLINGDGNSGTAATSVNGSTYDSTAAGKLTLQMYLTWRMSAWTRPTFATTIVARVVDVVKMLLLNAGSANEPAVEILKTSLPDAMSFMVQRQLLDGTVVVDNANVPAGKLLGVDQRYTLEMLLEAGSDITQTEQVINKQYNSIVITENIGFDIFLPNLNQLLDTAN